MTASMHTCTLPEYRRGREIDYISDESMVRQKHVDCLNVCVRVEGFLEHSFYKIASNQLDKNYIHS